MASILWRPAPWYGWGWEAGDDVDILLLAHRHYSFMINVQLFFWKSSLWLLYIFVSVHVTCCICTCTCTFRSTVTVCPACVNMFVNCNMDGKLWQIGMSSEAINQLDIKFHLFCLILLQIRLLSSYNVTINMYLFTKQRAKKISDTRHNIYLLHFIHV